MACSFRCCSFLVLGILGLAGCVANQYEVELTPQGDKIERKISAWRGSDENFKEFPDEELKKIAGAYQADVPKKRDQKHKFAGIFEGQMPDDLGGAGTYIHWETSLGTSSAYVERFRGSDDLLGNVEFRLKACDRLTDLLIGWMESELQADPGFPALKTFLDEKFRRDVKNLSMHNWTFAALKQVHRSDLPESVRETFGVRIGQYLVERSYFSVDDLPRLVRAFEEANDGNPRRLLAFVQRLVASKMNIAADQPVPESLKFLADLKELERSFNDYVRQSDEYQRFLQQSRDKATDKNAEPPKPIDVPAGLIYQAFPWWSLSDQLTLKLSVPTAPYLTNGQWEAEAQQIRWSHRIEEASSEFTEFPTVVYAFWSQPNQEAQTRLFGRVILEGQSLGEYSLWARGLSEAEAKEWQTFLASLKPGTDLETRIKAFHFSHEPAPREGENPKGLAARGRQWLLQGLGTDAN